MRKAGLNKKYILGMVGVLLFILFLTPLLPGTASAAEHVDNMYALVVTTGNDPGDNVAYFALEYVDTDGYTHKEHVFPHKGGLRDTLERASHTDAFGNLPVLAKGQTNTYFFEPEYEVSNILGLDIYCQGKQGSLHSWDVSGMRLYRVDQILGVSAQATNYTVRFNGSQIAALQERPGNGGVTFSWTGNTLFRLREGEPATHQLVFETIPYSMEGSHDYVLRMDIADVTDAGFELLNQPYNEAVALRDMNIRETLALQIEYLDVFGDLRVATYPVMTTVVDWLLENGISGDAKIAGIAQQGDTVAFGCCLQDMQQVKAIMLYTGSEARELLGGNIAGSESASFTGFSVYPASAVSVSLSEEENSADGPQYLFTGNPLFYHTATAAVGETVSADNTHYVSMRPYEAGSALAPVETTEKYLIELIAAPSQLTGVPEDIFVKLKYVDMSGNTRQTEAYSVRSSAREFYGYWPASTDDFAYTGQINGADGLCFVMELSQVEHFTGLTVSVPQGTSDWQLGGFRVVRLDSLSKRSCVWEDVVSGGGMSNRRYFRNAEGYEVFSMEEKALIQPGTDYEMNFISQSVQEVEDIDWSEFRYSMSYDQCSSNLGLAKVRENYTVEVQVQSGTTSVLDGYGDNGSKNRFYFLLEFENGASGYVLANQQLSADGFRSGCTETFVISTNYDYGELVAVHIIPDDISEGSDPYDKLNIAQIRVRRSDNGSISKEWVVQNVGWIGIDYRDEGASGSITGQQGRTEAEIARVYPVSYSSYALNLEFRLGTGSYTESGAGGAFYGTVEATLEYYNQDGKRNQVTFDVVRAMYDYANRSPIYLSDGTTGSTGMPLAVTDNSFMFRENHTDRFIISVSDVARLGKLTLNMKSLNGGSLAITNVSAALVMEAGPLQINEQDEYVRMGTTEFLCEDTVDKVPAFELFLPMGRNIYQEVYFGEHEAIKLDEENNSWISAVSRVPESKNDTVNVFVYPAEYASGRFELDVRAQYTNSNGTILETGAKNLRKTTDSDGRTVYSVMGLNASGMATLNKVYVKAQSADVVDAHIDHVIVQQIRSGVVINTFYLDCEHKNADFEFYALPSSTLPSPGNEQKVYLSFGDGTESANLVPENRDVAVALQYTTVSGGSYEFTSGYVYITDQQYQAIQAGDLVELTFRESYVREITGVLIATSGNVKAQVDMVCVDNYQVDTENATRKLLDHFSFPTGTVVHNNVAQLKVSDETSVQVLDIEFVTAAADAQLESGTDSAIAMVVGYTDSMGSYKEAAVSDIRGCVISEGDAFATGSVTRIRLLLRDAASIRWVQLMPYDDDPRTTAGWKPNQITVSLGADGSVQRLSRSVEQYIYEDVELDPNGTITGQTLGGLRISLANIIVTADVKATNESGIYGNSYRVSSAGNRVLSLTVPSGAAIKVNVDISNSEAGYYAEAQQTDSLRDVSGLLSYSGSGFTLNLPENTTGEDQTYRITVVSRENENVTVQIDLVVKSEVIEEEPTEPSAPADPTDPTDPTEPSEPTETTDPTESEEQTPGDSGSDEAQTP